MYNLSPKSGPADSFEVSNLA